MKPPDLMVVTADQRGSRVAADLVPQALEALEGLDGITLSFERTAGDEIQGLLSSADTVLEALTRLSRLGGWRVGLGLGTVEQPLPASTREARGEAYLRAREAVEHARSVPAELRLVGPVSGTSYDQVEATETVLWLISALWRRRSAEGWEVAQLLTGSRTATSVATMLGISPSAVSQRAGRAHLVEERRGRQLARAMLMDLGMES